MLIFIMIMISSLKPTKLNHSNDNGYTGNRRKVNYDDNSDGSMKVTGNKEFSSTQHFFRLMMRDIGILNTQ